MLARLIISLLGERILAPETFYYDEDRCRIVVSKMYALMIAKHHCISLDEP